MSWESDFGDMIGIPYVDTSYDQPRTPQTVVSDIVTQRQDVSTGGNDAWGGVFQKILSVGAEYAIKRDAAITGAKLQAATRPVAPVYTAGVAAGPAGLTISPLLLVVGVFVVLAVVTKK